MPHRSLHVLVVDDAQAIRQLIETALRHQGHRVVCCQNGQEALERCMAGGEPFDVIVLDHHMPLLDGQGVARSLRADPGLCRTPLISISGDPAREVVFGEGQSLFDRHVPKPISPRELISAIHACTRERGAQIA